MMPLATAPAEEFLEATRMGVMPLGEEEQAEVVGGKSTTGSCLSCSVGATSAKSVCHCGMTGCACPYLPC